MELRRARRAVLSVCAGLALAASPLTGAGAGPATAPVGGSVATPAGPAATDGGELLDEPGNGRAAVRALGGDLQVAAARNDVGAAELRELLLSDPTAWVDGRGRLFYKDPLPAEHAPAHPTGPTAPAAGAFPRAETFRLHSNPGAQRTIYLDFDGGTVSGTSWNHEFPTMGTRHPAWSTDADASGFSAAERDAIQHVWQVVAEDYAPFDVDVTTEDPGDAALHRTSRADERYGSWALITPSTDAAGVMCGNGCGGIAYIGTFDAVAAGHYQPAWVFPHTLGDDPKTIAEAVSHEVGHNLGLEHDGRAEPYYLGHGAWAPIMGAGYDRPVSQWSSGDYAGATNRQDDFAVMRAFGLPLHADDHAGTTGGATALGAGTSVRVQGLVSTRSDRDVFALVTTCDGLVDVAVKPDPLAPNLDVRLRLLDAGGARLATSDPASARVNRSLASGLSASLAGSLPAGRYFLEVDGVGVGDPSVSGYSDYGSVGAYSVRVTGCLGDPPVRPGRVAIGQATSGVAGGAITARATWTRLASAVTGYRVTALRLSRTGTVLASRRSDVLAPTRGAMSVRLPARGTYVFTVQALNGTVAGRMSARSNRVAGR